MRISISSVLTVHILMSVLIAVICPMLRNNRLLMCTGLKWTMLALILITIRLVFPIEPFYAHSIYFREVFTTIREILVYEFKIGDVTVQVYELLLVIWGIGIIIHLLIKWMVYHRIHRIIHICKQSIPASYDPVVVQISQKYPELSNTNIMYVPELSYTPLLMGFRNYKIILSSVEYSAAELKYILGHEAMHIRNRDVMWKSLIDFLGIVYWWNPLIKYMQNSLFEMIEINNDLKLTEEMSDEEKEGYLECLYRVIKSAKPFECVATVAFTTKTVRTMHRRFDFITKRVGQRRVPKYIAMLLAVLVISVSTCVVFEPSFPAPEGTFRPSEENMYAIYNNGVYEIYYNGEYAYSETTLEYFPDSMIVYEEEYHDKQSNEKN